MLLPGILAGQGPLDGFSYDGLEFSGFGVELGGVTSDRLESGVVAGIRVDYGYFAPRVRMVFGLSYFKEDFDRDEIVQFESSLRRVVIDPTNDFVIVVGDISLSNIQADNLTKFAKVHYTDINGDQQAYLTEDEARYLTIRKGSLDDAERSEIESHVAHTYRFLMEIPWTKELKDIPMIAYGHHEKLNGRGYPRSLDAPDIPIQTRMMTIADIFDALTAADRPYKRAMTIERALSILADEVKGEMLDPDLFKVFVEAKSFEKKVARASGMFDPA